MTIFDTNTVGPRSYISMYDKYRDILTGQSDRDKEAFLASEASLDQFRARMLSYAELRDEISHIRQVTCVVLVCGATLPPADGAAEPFWSLLPGPQQ